MFRNESMKQVIAIAVGSLLLMCIMQVLFGVFGYFSYKSLLGGLIGVGTAVLNFGLLALTLELSLGKGSKRAQGYMGMSYLLRLALIAVIVVLSIRSNHINYLAVVIPLIFPRIVIMVLNLSNSKKDKKEDSNERTQDTV